jgi:hypothetical protein
VRAANEKDLHCARSLLPKASFEAQGTTDVPFSSHLLTIRNRSVYGVGIFHWNWINCVANTPLQSILQGWIRPRSQEKERAKMTPWLTIEQSNGLPKCYSVHNQIAQKPIKTERELTN